MYYRPKKSSDASLEGTLNAWPILIWRWLRPAGQWHASSRVGWHCTALLTLFTSMHSHTSQNICILGNICRFTDAHIWIYVKNTNFDAKINCKYFKIFFNQRFLHERRGESIFSSNILIFEARGLSLGVAWRERKIYSTCVHACTHAGTHTKRIHHCDQAITKR